MEGNETYTSRLVEIIKTEGVALWVPCSGVASAVEDAQAKEFIEQHTRCKCIQFDISTTSVLHEKDAFMRETKSRALPVPDTHDVKSKDDVIRILSDHADSTLQHRFILKPIGVDDINRGNMTLLPLSTSLKTKEYVSRLPISASNPWILQQFIPGGEEYCTHALIVRGEIKCFVACPSAELLMHYTPLPRNSTLWQAMYAFTIDFVKRSSNPEFMTGHLSFDFMVCDGAVHEGRFERNIFVIECNPRTHTAVVLFGQQSPEMGEMVQAYLSAIGADEETASSASNTSELPNGIGQPLVIPSLDAQQSMRSFETVLALIEDQASSYPEYHAIGFANFKLDASSQRPPEHVSFLELRDLSRLAASILDDLLRNQRSREDSPTIGLLFTSSLDFILTWLGLLRLRCKAFLLAPQLEPQAIEHLCTVSGVRTILIDDGQGQKVTQLRDNINIVKIPTYQRDRHTNPHDYSEMSLSREALDIAYLRHTSGTSSGLPKPIIQSQWGAVGCLPSFTDTDQPGTFSTTPLYHGGLADCLRAWTSGAMIWFFPEGVVPITGANVRASVHYAREVSSSPVKYFSSVPYVLQMLAEDDDGVHLLQEMDLVGVGGAALPPSVGNKLVDLNVNLVSRMGSAECGFVMSSHRDYAEDKEWQYLRPIDDPTFLSFEHREDGLSELVVKSQWPLISKVNRGDGSYATADLFEVHPSIPNAWRYHSRADAQITLANGKKFDPSPLEDSIRASTSLLKDVLIFGAGKDYVGALLFKTSQDLSDEGALEAIWPLVQKLNSETQSHARLTRSMLVVIQVREGEEPLPKSSKGTIMRRQAEETYADIISRAYSGKATISEGPFDITNDNPHSILLNIFSQVLGCQVDPQRDLFHQGVDSIACMQIKKLIEAHFMPKGSPRLPINVIYDNGTIDALAISLTQICRGNDQQNTQNDHDELDLMRALSEKYSQFKPFKANSTHRDGIVITLTGATGTLGAHILSQLCSDNRVCKVYCLLRAQDKFAAHQRISKALLKRCLSGIEHLKESHGCQKISCLPCNLSEPKLGLSDDDWAHIVTESTILIHSAWTVNFSLRLGSFENHIAGTRNMINAAMSGDAQLFFISSTAAVSSDPSAIIPERISSDPSHASSLGYSRSKWAAEHVCAAAFQESLKSPPTGVSKGPNLSIIRVGQLCGNEIGIWNTSEAYPLMLSSASLTGCLPDLPNEPLNWLPVDLAAKAVLEIALSDQFIPTMASSRDNSLPDIPVYHVLNPHKTPSWCEMLDMITEGSDGSLFEKASPAEWLERLESATSTLPGGHPSQALLGLWKRRYAQWEPRQGIMAASPTFGITSSSRASQTVRDVKPLNRDRIMNMWNWIQENMGTKKPGHLSDVVNTHPPQM
ncbi:hypothetical protein F5B20DRAFT_577434 [Whalleya microplaca]|nr:hypothetical protein F5B20DRAFT_577434 [Whalleya microplaca]